MPDLQKFKITPLAATNVNVPRATIEGQICDSTTGALLHDFTGANALTFPGVLTTLTVEQRRVLVERLASWLLMVKGGFE
jgi:hypothetical protein